MSVVFVSWHASRVFTLTSSPVSFLSQPLQRLCCLLHPVKFFFPFHRSLTTLRTVVLNSSVLHKSPLHLAACCGRFYNPALRRRRGLFQHLRRLKGCWETKRPASVWESSRWLLGGKATFSLWLLSCFTCCIIPLTVLPISAAKLRVPICLFMSFLPPADFYSLSLFLFFTDWPTSQLVYKVKRCSSSERILSSRCVYVTEARPVKGWSPDKRKGLMIGNVARATHKHFRDVNKCVRAQRGRSRSLFKASA